MAIIRKLTGSRPTGAQEPSAGALRPNVVGAPGALMQGIAAIGPAYAALFTIPFIVSYAGVLAPLAYLGAFIIALLLGYVLTQYTRHLASAGTYYTFVSRSLGGRIGLVVGWVYLLNYPFAVAQIAAFTGLTIQNTIAPAYGVTIEWWWFALFLIALCTVTTWRSLKLSIELLIVLGAIEIGIVLALAFWGMASPGRGGLSLSWLSGGHGVSAHGLFLGVVFAIFAIMGWDAAAPLAEESRNPRRIIPRAVIGSIVILGVILVLTSWGQTTGWGTNALSSMATSSQLPALALGHKYWAGAWIVVLIALVTSATAVALACNNAATRILFGMARVGALPSALSKVRGASRSPVNAVIAQTVISLVVGIGVAWAIGPANLFDLFGVWLTFAMAIVFVMAGVGVYVFYRKEHPDEFSWFKHGVIPLIGILALGVVVYYSLDPLPAWPVSLAPFIVLGWLAIGIAIVIFAYRGERGEKLSRAGYAVLGAGGTVDREVSAPPAPESR